MNYFKGQKVRIERCVCPKCDKVNPDNTQDGEVHADLMGLIGKEVTLGYENGKSGKWFYIDSKDCVWYFSIRCFSPSVLEDLQPDSFFTQK